MENSFDKISESYKIYKEETKYEELNTHLVNFDGSSLELDSFTNLNDIIKEISEISRKIFSYSIILESQSKVLQQLEDEFEVWMAKKYFEIDSLFPSEKKVKRTETEKKNLIITHFENEYRQFKGNLSKEAYKLGLIKRVVSSLENYGYKLHALKDHSIAANQSR